MNVLISKTQEKENGMKYDEFARNARNFDGNEDGFEYFEDARRRSVPNQGAQFQGAPYQGSQFQGGQFQAPQYAPPQMQQANMGAYGLPDDYKGVLEYEPRSPEDVQILIDYLKQCHYAIVKLDNVPPDDAQRVLDFVSGAIYALNGSVHRITGNIFFVSPQGAELTVPYGNKK